MSQREWRAGRTVGADPRTQERPQDGAVRVARQPAGQAADLGRAAQARRPGT